MVLEDVALDEALAGYKAEEFRPDELVTPDKVRELLDPPPMELAGAGEADKLVVPLVVRLAKDVDTTIEAEVKFEAEDDIEFDDC